jgi:hypothetical protein
MGLGGEVLDIENLILDIRTEWVRWTTVIENGFWLEDMKYKLKFITTLTRI